MRRNRPSSRRASRCGKLQHERARFGSFGTFGAGDEDLDRLVIMLHGSPQNLRGRFRLRRRMKNETIGASRAEEDGE
jgi:hypothetical protein